jgi:predicted phosphodiesterase
MRIAVFSDIHGNGVALEAMLADLNQHPADQLVCLGDAVQGGPQPAQVVSRLRELSCPVVMGNADAWLLTGKETGSEAIAPDRKRKMDDVRAWMLEQLSDDDKAFIAQFHPTVELPLDANHELLCFHGSPKSFDDLIFPHTPEEDVQNMLGTYISHILTGGHTHLQQIRRIGASDTFFFNPGSVGLAYSHHQTEKDFRADPWAEYALLSVQDGRVSLEFRRVVYDVAPLIDAYRTSGRPHAADSIAQYNLP